MTLADLHLSPRAARCLAEANIRTVLDLCARSPRDLLNIRTFGRKSLTEIREALAMHGLRLAPNKRAVPPSVHLPPVEFRTDVIAIVRDRIVQIIASGTPLADIAAAVAPAWDSSPERAEATIQTDFLDGAAVLRADSLGPLLRVLGLRIVPGPDTDDVRAIVRERALALAKALPPDPRAGRFRWKAVAERLATAWDVSVERCVEALSRAFGDNPSQGVKVDRLGPVLDVLGLQIVPAKEK